MSVQLKMSPGKRSAGFKGLILFLIWVLGAGLIASEDRALLVLKNGKVIPVAGEFMVQGAWVRFRTIKSDDLVSLPLRVVDLEASWSRTDAWRQAQAAKAQKAKDKPKRGLLKLERPRAAIPDPELKSAALPAPKMGRHRLLLPTFESKFGSKYAGSAFLVRLSKDSPVLLVTAHGLLSQAAGFPRQLNWWELSQQITGVNAYSARDGRTLRASRVLPIDSARPVTPDQANRDLAAFVLDSDKVTAFRLDTQPPEVGERVWLFADPVRDKVLSGAILHEARVVSVTDEMIEYRFLKRNEKLEGVRGAAVINASSRVVAMHVAGGLMDEGWTGWGNPAAAIRGLLVQGLQETP